MFKLRFSGSQLRRYAQRFADSDNDEELRLAVRPKVLARGFLTRREFLQICEWKTQRSKSRCAQNSAFVVETVSRAALATSDEPLKMNLLRTLAGVEWPTASTLLHFSDRRPYPILDYRALWSLGYDTPPHYTMAFWLQYLAFTRRLARRLGQDIRTVDRALWQYSKERHPSKTNAP